MIECFVSSLIGTLLALLGSFFIIRYRINKDAKKDEKLLKELIEELTTFKIKVEDVF